MTIYDYNQWCAQGFSRGTAHENFDTRRDNQNRGGVSFLILPLYCDFFTFTFQLAVLVGEGEFFVMYTLTKRIEQRCWGCIQPSTAPLCKPLIIKYKNIYVCFVRRGGGGLSAVLINLFADVYEHGPESVLDWWIIRNIVIYFV